jgi:HEAT repeat protein
MHEIERLLKELGNPDWWTRSSAINGLLNYPEKFYLSFLEEALRDQENAVLRNGAMEFYVVLGDRAVLSLIGLLKDEDPEVRLFSANLLGDIADKRAIPELVLKLKDSEVNVRVASAEALGKIGDPGAITALCEAVDDEPWVTMSAIKSLGDIGGDDALDVLYLCLSKEEYRGITFDAIEKAGKENAIRQLTPFIEKDDLKELALRAIVNIAEREGITLMPGYFVNLVPLLIDLQCSPHPEIKRAAFIALSWARDLRGLTYLIDALPDDELQEYAISGIMCIGKEAVPGIIEALRDAGRPQRCVLAKMVSMMGEHSELLRFSEDDDPEVRVEVALALGQIHLARTGEILSRMLDDPEDEVRLVARKASQKFKKENKWPA